ncbi:winged helix-turn-helix transcriptional regulator [Allomuricauda sp. SCSIO 65647]|uniref:winged helix-turn-helix transcriptional regulator n=1 Tax=Allomuricauda sp. SCSIO 65647 TaxID=2908843 RepID=UPI001F3C4CFE|nr:helix-turn-helix domain-containing protein [Muricauda sp. SCSIO 65647]UJH69110.1 helix-turn-helix transcriptional regulator [Muricauda sp. SCSIO 65647]
MRSDCPVSFALDLFGDKWTFLIIRDLVQGKKFYNDFLHSKEGIATNILSDRLKKLEHNGIVESKVFEALKTKKEYSMTEKGKDLIPVLIEIIIWSDKHQSDLAVSRDFINKANKDREGLISEILLGLK